jgi:hypothetical protein
LPTAATLSWSPRSDPGCSRMCNEILLSFVLYALLVLLPTVPAVITYRASPDKPIVADGKLGWLTFKTGGAFAAYVIALTLSYALGSRIMDMIEASHHARLSPTTTLRMQVRLLDENGEPMNESLHGLAPIVRLQPSFYTSGDNSISIRVPGNPDDYSYGVEIPNFGAGFRAQQDVRTEPDPDKPNTLRLSEPIELRPQPR